MVYYCCRELGINWKTLPYCLLGDDIVIANKLVGELYIQTILSLGMEVSSAKTHTSPHFYEFAKRLIHKNREITHFPISSIKESSKRYYHLTNTLLQSKEMGWLPKGRFGVPFAVSELYGFLYNMPKRFRNEIFIKSYISERIILVIQGRLTAFNAIHGIIRRLDLPSVPASEYHMEIQMRNVMLELFTESDPNIVKKDIPKGKPLGDLATDLVCHFTSFVEDPLKCELGLSLISAYPVLSVYGQVEERYLKLKKEGSDIITNFREWPMLMQNMALPISDNVFTQHAERALSGATSVLGRKLVSHIRNLVSLPT